jgi:D-3-phosphoglycerate dehydrogenase
MIRLDGLLLERLLSQQVSVLTDRKEKSMADTVVEALILDLLEWLASGERSYEEVMDAWRTSCPRLPVWEDANDRGLVRTDQVNGRSVVRATPSGLAFLERHRNARGSAASTAT